MHGPAMSGWLLMVLCSATGLYCLIRMRSCRGADRKAAGGEALMGLGMAVMAVPATVFTLPSWQWVVYAVVFGAAAVHAVRPGGRHLHHAVGCLAMVYMAAAMAGTGAHGAHTAGGFPLLTGVLLLYFAGYVLRSGPRLVSFAPVGGGTVPVADPAGSRPELVPACRVSMATAMLVMLLAL
ncbi:DUF5134 domain-containing protein [Streptomyces sp. V1I6]|uniref:DUF5134 domain-containing protein n=1 Tax=Streptomyces sp. V1I6 TaxID=3042273 RepID=UPI002780EE5D|nr:DUF5134 domain-containing protein [Streptomyces sp. V1I6]MDQ0841204.1 hypothetical protein [Streptomyces sp. V1I6]